MRRSSWFVILLVLATTGMAWARIGDVPIRNLPVVGGSHDPVFAPAVGSDRAPGGRGTLDSIGTAYTAGTTYYDYQHNGTQGRMIYTDQLGFVHVVWMKGMTTDPLGPRHVFYNVWDPVTQSFRFEDTGGRQVNSSTRGGYITVTGQREGWVYPAYHETRQGVTGTHATAAMDFMPYEGAFTSNQPRLRYDPGVAAPIDIIWPKIAIGLDSTIHMVSTESPASGVAGDPQRIYYSRGRPTWTIEGDPPDTMGVQVEWEVLEANSGYQLVDTVMVIAPFIFSSPISNRVAIIWSKSRDDLTGNPTQYNNDVYLMVSEDGGLNWEPEVNVTNFAYPDYDCPTQDTLICDRDTFRVYTDMNGLFDLRDNVHIVFTTSYLYELEGIINVAFSDIWHWSDQFDEFANVVHGYFDSTTWSLPTPSCGAWQRVVQRPCLSLDPTTGYLYCSFHRYDSLHVSAAGYPQGEAYVTMSRNCGRSWSEAVDVSQTVGEEGAAAGECKSERDITLYDRVTYENEVGYLHMSYVYDLDAGGIPQNEGTATNSPVRYQRIPIDSIPPLPIHDPYYPNLRYDSTGFPGRVIPLDPEAVAACYVPPIGGVGPDHALVPETFRLYQNYPNPFNPVTRIQFDLARDARVRLNVFNVLGEKVATLFDGKMLNAGTQSATFDASNLASGVYVYRLEVDGAAAAARKMVLMK